MSRKMRAPQPPASGIYADQRYVAFRRPHPPCSLLLLSRPLGGVEGVRGSGGRAPIAPPTPRSSLFFVLPAPSSVVLPRPPSLLEEGERSPWRRVPALALYRPFDIRAQRRNPVEGVSANFRGALQASAAAAGKHRRIANMRSCTCLRQGPPPCQRCGLYGDVWSSVSSEVRDMWHLSCHRTAVGHSCGSFGALLGRIRDVFGRLGAACHRGRPGPGNCVFAAPPGPPWARQVCICIPPELGTSTSVLVWQSRGTFEVTNVYVFENTQINV